MERPPIEALQRLANDILRQRERAAQLLSRCPVVALGDRVPAALPAALHKLWWAQGEVREAEERLLDVSYRLDRAARAYLTVEREAGRERWPWQD